MIKTYLDNSDTIIKAYNENLKFQAEVYEKIHEDFMDMQANEAKNAEVKGLDIHDHYTSFYFTIRDRDSFLDSAVDNNYLVTNKNINLHKELKEKMNEYYNMKEDDPKFSELDSYLDEKANELMEDWEDILHGYEYIIHDDIESYITDSMYFDDFYKDYYVIDDDYSKIYIDIPSHTEQKY